MADEEEVEYFYHQLLIRGVLTRRLASLGFLAV
jgi:hypothetical protein